MPKRQQKKSVTVSTGGKEEKQQSVTVKKRMRKQRSDEVEERSEKDLFVRVSIPTNDAMGNDQEEEEEDELLVDVEHVDEPPDEARSFKKLEIPGKSRREKVGIGKPNSRVIHLFKNFLLCRKRTPSCCCPNCCLCRQPFATSWTKRAFCVFALHSFKCTF